MSISEVGFIEKQATGFLDNFWSSIDFFNKLIDETGSEDAIRSRDNLLSRYNQMRLSGAPASENNSRSDGGRRLRGGPESPSKKKKATKTPRPRELMTLKRAGKVTEGHITLLFMKLTKEGWIDGIDGDFKAFFSGKRDERCILTWMGVYGKSTLVELFRQFVNEGLVTVPYGYSLPYILEGHFMDQTKKWLTGLDKGDKANDKALPIILECVNLLKASPEEIIYGHMQDYDDEDYRSEYDPNDHQDMHIHNPKGYK